MLRAFKSLRGRLLVPVRPFFTAAKKPTTEGAALNDERESGAETSEPEDTSAKEDVMLKLKELDEKIADINAKITLADKDAEQATKRYYQQKEDATKYAYSKFAKDSLEVADNLKRITLSVTAEQMESEPDLKRVIEAVKKSQTSLSAFYKKYGIVEEDPVGKPFDPNHHDAMFEVPLPHQANGTVAHVIQSGYLIHERVLRPARVGVVRNH
jgi:molecular chaperone GrpE